MTAILSLELCVSDWVARRLAHMPGSFTAAGTTPAHPTFSDCSPCKQGRDYAGAMLLLLASSWHSTPRQLIALLAPTQRYSSWAQHAGQCTAKEVARLRRMR